jgi:hypothetical protein
MLPARLNLLRRRRRRRGLGWFIAATKDLLEQILLLGSGRFGGIG